MTGDLVQSSKTKPSERGRVLERLRGVFDSVARETRQELDNQLGGFQIFRGDSFQTVLADPEDSLRVALLLRARCLLQVRLDVRLAVGIGAIEYESPRSVGEASGPAYTLSGHALDRMARERLTVVTENGLANPELAALTALVDALFRSWSKRSLEVVAESLLGHSQEQVGESLGVTQSAVSQRLGVAQWWAVERALARSQLLLRAGENVRVAGKPHNRRS